jgi:hypothetical protein
VIEPGDEVVLYDWDMERAVGIAAWRVAAVEHAQGLLQLDLKPGVWVDARPYRVILTKEEVAGRMLTREW